MSKLRNLLEDKGEEKICKRCKGMRYIMDDGVLTEKTLKDGSSAFPKTKPKPVKCPVCKGSGKVNG